MEVRKRMWDVGRQSRSVLRTNASCVLCEGIASVYILHTAHSLGKEGLGSRSCTTGSFLLNTSDSGARSLCLSISFFGFPVYASFEFHAHAVAVFELCGYGYGYGAGCLNVCCLLSAVFCLQPTAVSLSLLVHSPQPDGSRACF